MAKRSKISIDSVKTMLQKGQFKKAEKHLGAMVELDPNNLEALILHGRVLMQLNRLNEAVRQFQAALLLAPDHTQCVIALGAVRFSQSQYEASEELFLRALHQAPGSVEVMGNLGIVAQHLGKHDDALRFLGEAVKGGSTNAKVIESLGQELMHQNIPNQAAAVLSRLTQGQPANAKALTLLGNAFGYMGDMPAAEKYWRQAEKVDSTSPEPVAARARALMESGELDRSITLMEQVLKLDPTHAATLFYWAYVADKDAASTFLRQDVITMAEGALQSPSINRTDLVRVEFAAGKLYENNKQPERAISHYIHANELMWERQPLPKEDFQAIFQKLQSQFDAALFARHETIMKREPNGADQCGDGLIFIVGMPRSGTTLVEQIVSKHVDVTPGGERPEMDVMLNHFVAEAGGSVSTLQVSMELARRLAGGHHEQVSKHAGNGKMFTDKMPRNFMNLGMIALLFPWSTIIHCVRDPVDTCLSCYFNHFGFNAVKYSYDQDFLGFFYTLYREMMETWKATLPLAIHDAVYEDLVNDPETAVRNLTDHCGFSWQEAFLHPEQSDGAVRTASLAQVKKPIYTNSVNRWAPYKDHLGPLLKSLGIGDNP